MELSQKVAYLKGLMDGLKVDESTNEGKILKVMADILDEMALTVEDIADEVMLIALKNPSSVLTFASTLSRISFALSTVYISFITNIIVTTSNIEPNTYIIIGNTCIKPSILFILLLRILIHRIN